MDFQSKFFESCPVRNQIRVWENISIVVAELLGILHGVYHDHIEEVEKGGVDARLNSSCSETFKDFFSNHFKGSLLFRTNASKNPKVRVSCLVPYQPFFPGLPHCQPCFRGTRN